MACYQEKCPQCGRVPPSRINSSKRHYLKRSGEVGGAGASHSTPRYQVWTVNNDWVWRHCTHHCTIVLNKMSRFDNLIFQSSNNATSSFDILPSHPLRVERSREMASWASQSPHPSTQTSQLTGVDTQPTPTYHPAHLYQARALFKCLWIILREFVLKHTEMSHLCPITSAMFASRHLSSQNSFM